MSASCPSCGATVSADDRFCPKCGAALPEVANEPSAPEAPGAEIPPGLEDSLRAALAPTYQLIRPLGVGGMGAVFLAREPALKRTVAVKVLSPELAADPASRARFEREAQAVAGLSHPNVVSVHAVGQLEDGLPYFVMQYVSGRSLAARLAEDGPLSVAETRRILGEVASALAAAHAKGIIHRDIKPANILADDESGRVLVSDFGIAAITPRKDAGESGARLTQTGMIVGTPKYMSPEQLLAEPVSDKTDLYALGLLGYELLTGAGPFHATTPEALIAAHLRDTPRHLAEVRDDVDADLDALVSRCLDRNPDDRPTADEVARRLAPGGGVLLEWPPPGIEELAGGFARATRWYWIGSLLLLAAVLPLVLAGPALDLTGQSLMPVLLLLCGVLGLAALIGGAHVTLRLGAAATGAVRGGFAWLTVLETLADRRGDTGSLIAGTGRFANVPVERRSRLRRSRVIRAAALAIGGALPLPVMVLVLMLASLGAGFPSLSWLALLPLLVALGIALRLGRVERRLAPAARRAKRAGQPSDIARLSGSWYDGFESVRQGQAMGRGSAARPSVGRVGAWVAVGLAVIGVLIVVPLVAIGLFSQASLVELIPKFANTRQKADLVQVARPFGVAKDSSITPLEAGRAFAILNPRRPSAMVPTQPLPRLGPLPWDSAIPAGTFPTAQPIGSPGLPDSRTILEAATRGFSPAEMAYLERVAHSEVWRYFGTVARAPAVDFLGSEFRIPFSDRAMSYAMPIPSFGTTKELAYAGVSRAAWFLARGQRDSAETALREVVSFGFAIMDDAPYLIEELIGVVTVGIGRGNLQQLYTLTGNPLGLELAARSDSARAVADERMAASEAALSGTRVSAPAQLAQFLAIVGDTSQLHGLRMELLQTLGFSSCGNLREMLFGPDAAVEAAFAEAREHLARFDSERSLLDMFATGPERLGRSSGSLPWNPPGGLFRGVVYRASDLLGAVLGNRRIPGCARMILH